jgi:hypothetical protein
MIHDTEHTQHIQRQRGAGLLEVMVTLAVVAFGVVGIIYLQGELSTQSASNKARVEAIVYAEEVIEEIRSYAASPAAAYYKEGFIPGLTAGPDEVEDNFLSPKSIDGTNARFTRTIEFTGITEDDPYVPHDTDTAEVTVTVSWTDRNDASQSVVMKSDITWESPGLAASLLTVSDSDTFTAPTGIALIGEGDIDAITEKTQVGETNLDDGIAFYVSGDTLYLVDTNVLPNDEGFKDDIVMTFPDICADQSAADCADDVVTINGRVYIDKNSPYGFDDLRVKSSDVTYCTQFNEAATSVANPDYKYFDYRCYASFGWYGNIGLVINGGYSSSDRVCQGDPTLVDPALDYVYGQPVLSPRRVYRGMYYIPDDANPSGKVEGDGIPLYWSVGVAAGTTLGLDENGEPYHNFLIGNNRGDTSTPRSSDPADFCIETGVMGIPEEDPQKRPDSTLLVDGVPVPGQLFAGNHDDFYCLNPYVDQNSLDSLNIGTYAIDEDCPFDPSSPPVRYYLVTGGFENTSSGSVTLNSSLESATCDISSSPYSCEIFDWGGGWTGYIQVNNESASTACNYDRIYMTLPESESGTVFPLDTWDINWDVSCEQGSASIVRGYIDLLDDRSSLIETDEPAVRIFSAIGVDLQTTDINLDTAPEGNCSYLSSTYSCVTENYSPESGWEGMLIVNTDGYVCDSYGLDAEKKLVRDPITLEPVINGGGVFLLGEERLLVPGEVQINDITITAPNREGDCPL